MKGKINQYGILLIYRTNDWVMTECKPGGGNCSHDCSLFSEPRSCKTNGKTYVGLCQGKFQIFDDFKDERIRI